MWKDLCRICGWGLLIGCLGKICAQVLRENPASSLFRICREHPTRCLNIQPWQVLRKICGVDLYAGLARYLWRIFAGSLRKILWVGSLYRIPSTSVLFKICREHPLQCTRSLARKSSQVPRKTSTVLRFCAGGPAQDLFARCLATISRPGSLRGSSTSREHSLQEQSLFLQAHLLLARSLTKICAQNPIEGLRETS